MEPVELLRVVRGRLDAQRETKVAYAERLAPEFTPFEFIDTRETGLSQVLAWMLDPGGSHAQGPRFLIEFMKWLGLDASWLELASCARVSTEVSTQFGSKTGRIDVLAACGERALAIENKPSAGDQTLQVARYLEDMEQRWPKGLCLLYLSGDGEGPSAVSISSDQRLIEEERGRLVVRGYGALPEWLTTCRTVCRAPSVSLMLDGFQTHVEQEFMGVQNMEAAIGLAAKVASSTEMLDAALSLFEAQRPLYAELLAGLVRQISAAAALRKWHVKCADISDSNYSMLVVSFSASAPVSFGISFDQSNYRYLIYGMLSDKGRRVDPSLREAARDVVGRGGSTNYWPVYRPVSPNDAFFPIHRDASREFWLMVHSGDFAKRFIDYVAAVERHLRKKGLLALAKGS